MNKLIIIILSLTICKHAFAWGDLGHETIAEIAQQLLKQNKKVNGAIHSLVGIEALAISATWPDKMRSDSRFRKFGPYHYTTQFVDGHKSEKDALTVLNKYPEILRDENSKTERRLLALRYLVHVMGDIHQPLHVGNEFDRGGNRCSVTWQPDENRAPYTTNLHKVWDTSIPKEILYKYKAGSTNKYFDYVGLAKALMEKYPDLVKKRPRVNVNKWVEQSNILRKSVVYPDPDTPDDQREYCQKNLASEVELPIIDKTYVDRASPIIERQIVLAGVRLAALLRKTYRGTTQDKPLDAKEVIESMQLTND